MNIQYVIFLSSFVVILVGSTVGPVPTKEAPTDLIIVNQEALNAHTTTATNATSVENANRLTPSLHPADRLTPVIRVWEGDFELVDVTSDLDGIIDFVKIQTNSNSWRNLDKNIRSYQYTYEFPYHKDTQFSSFFLV